MTSPEPARERTTNRKSYNGALKQSDASQIRMDKGMAQIASKASRTSRPPVFSGEEDRKAVQWAVFPVNANRF